MLFFVLFYFHTATPVYDKGKPQIKHFFIFLLILFVLMIANFFTVISLSLIMVDLFDTSLTKPGGENYKKKTETIQSAVSTFLI